MRRTRCVRVAIGARLRPLGHGPDGRRRRQWLRKATTKAAPGKRHPRESVLRPCWATSGMGAMARYAPHVQDVPRAREDRACAGNVPHARAIRALPGPLYACHAGHGRPRKAGRGDAAPVALAPSNPHHARQGRIRLSIGGINAAALAARSLVSQRVSERVTIPKAPTQLV